MTFHWYRSNGDGTADRFEDTPAICARIDAGERGWFGNPEGAILHGGVLACSYTRKVEATYDAMVWLKTGAMVPVGELVTIEVTATGDITSSHERRNRYGQSL